MNSFKNLKERAFQFKDKAKEKGQFLANQFEDVAKNIGGGIAISTKRAFVGASVLAALESCGIDTTGGAEFDWDAGGQGGVAGAAGKGGETLKGGQAGMEQKGGNSGVAGMSGKGGVSGMAGKAGEAGFAGMSGKSGQGGIAGMENGGQGGIAGTAGEGGVAGKGGAAGTMNVAGNSGASGKGGFAGMEMAGNAGAAGTMNVAGNSGTGGMAGIAGMNNGGSAGMENGGNGGVSGTAGEGGAAGEAGQAGAAGEAGAAGMAGAAGGPSCPTNGNLVFSGETCYEYDVYSGGVLQAPPQASDPDAMCVSTDCSVNVIPGDLVVFWNSTNTFAFTGPVNSVVCKCSTYSQPPHKSEIVDELNANPAPTTATDLGSGQSHKFTIAGCGPVSCMIKE